MKGEKEKWKIKWMAGKKIKSSENVLRKNGRKRQTKKLSRRKT